MKLIERKQYLDKMIGVIGTPDIKVLTGVRRSGKSKLLEAFKVYVQKNFRMPILFTLTLICLNTMSSKNIKLLTNILKIVTLKVRKTSF